MTDQPRDPSEAGGTGDEPTQHDIPAGGQQGASWEPQQPAYWQTEPTAVQPQPPYTPPPGQPAQPYGAPPSYGQQAPYGQQPSYGPPQPTSGQQGSSPYYPPSQSAAPVGGGGDDGFFQALVDFSFKKYVTPTIVKVVYILLIVFVVLYYLAIAVVAFDASSAFGVLWLLILGPLAAIIVLAGYRMMLELFVAVVRMAQDLRDIKERGSSL